MIASVTVDEPVTVQDAGVGLQQSDEDFAGEVLYRVDEQPVAEVVGRVVELSR